MVSVGMSEFWLIFKWGLLGGEKSKSSFDSYPLSGVFVFR